MGDVRIPAFATLLAAVIAVAGSIYVVWRNGRQQLRIQRGGFVERATAREEERRRAARAAEVDACVVFDAAVAVAVARLQAMVDLVGRPAVRRKLFGRDWAERWNREVTEATVEIAVPLSRVRLTAGAPVRHAVTAVATACEGAADAVASVPTGIPEVLMVGPVVRGWRARVARAIDDVQSARGELAAVLELTGEDAEAQPNLDRSAARS